MKLGHMEANGWVIFLGRATDPTAPKPKPGDVLPIGAVAGVNPDGASRWLRADRHPCSFAEADIPVLCDGDALHVISPTKREARPTVMEGINPKTGATTWTLPLNGAIDAGSEVLRLDSHRSVLAAPSGFTTVDLVTGPTPAAADAKVVGWCQPTSHSTDDIQQGARIRSYIRFNGEYPCHIGGKPVDDPPSLPVPTFAGVSSSGWSAWVSDGTIQAKRNG